MEKECYIRLKPDLTELEATIQKIEKLKSMLDEAMDIAESIASLKLDLRINTVMDDESTEWARITTE